MTERERALPNVSRLIEMAADLEEMATGYRKKADMLLREAACFRIAADREIARQAAAECQCSPVEPREPRP